MCGEMAGEDQAIPILLGLHLDQFSVNPSAVPSAKEIIRSLSLEESQRVAAAALNLKTEAEVRRYVDNALGQAVK